MKQIIKVKASRQQMPRSGLNGAPDQAKKALLPESAPQLGFCFLF